MLLSNAEVPDTRQQQGAISDDTQNKIAAQLEQQFGIVNPLDELLSPVNTEGLLSSEPLVLQLPVESEMAGKLDDVNLQGAEFGEGIIAFEEQLSRTGRESLHAGYVASLEGIYALGEAPAIGGPGITLGEGIAYNYFAAAVHEGVFVVGNTLLFGTPGMVGDAMGVDTSTPQLSYLVSLGYDGIERHTGIERSTVEGVVGFVDTALMFRDAKDLGAVAMDIFRRPGGGTDILSGVFGTSPTQGGNPQWSMVGSSGDVRPYEVGPANVLYSRSVPGDGLDIHHAGQAHPMQQLVPEYNRQNAPAIALPHGEHVQIPTVRGSVNGTARDQLAKDIIDLRNNTGAPNTSLQELIQLNKDMYPESFTK
jgi:hypothetical protein